MLKYIMEYRKMEASVGIIMAYVFRLARDLAMATVFGRGTFNRLLAKFPIFKQAIPCQSGLSIVIIR